MDTSDNTLRVFDDDKLETARTITRLPDQRKWRMELVAAVDVTPESLFKPQVATVQFREKIEGELAKGEPEHAVARQV